jgi:hypothetical protein
MRPARIETKGDKAMGIDDDPFHRYLNGLVPEEEIP